MKNKAKYIICLIILLGVGIFIYLNYFSENGDDFVYFKSDINYLMDQEYTLYTSYNDFEIVFGSKYLNSKDFHNYNYLVIEITIDECSEKDVKIEDYTIDGNIINVKFTYTENCDYCNEHNEYYYLKVDKNIVNPQVNIDFKANNDIECVYDLPNGMIEKKPLIYLYPEQDTSVVVKLGKPEAITSSYPKYDNGWYVKADINGNLKDASGRTYYGLYWEGNCNIDNKINDGFVVYKEDIIEFLEEKLAILGLNEREINEFIIYWLPELEKSDYNIIRFENIDVINKLMPLDINPIPDTVIRVWMEYKPINKVITLKEQELTPVVRDGFTVVEWGGSLVK